MANNKNRSGGRFNRFNRGNVGITKNTVFDSSGPCGRLRGTAPQLIEKYLAAAKEQRHNDPILSEVMLQHADHYTRLYAIACASEIKPEPVVVQPTPVPEAEAPVTEDKPTEPSEIEAETEVDVKPKKRHAKVQEEASEPEAAALKNLPFMEEPVVSEKKVRRKLTLEKAKTEE